MKIEIYYVSKENKLKISLVHRKSHIFKNGLEYKKCGHCKEIKLLNEFNKKKINWDGLYCWCRNCAKNIWNKNKEKNLQQARLYKNKNKEKIKIDRKIYYEQNKEKEITKNKLWKEKNKNHLQEYRRKYLNNKRKINSSYKLMCILRGKVSKLLKGYNKSYHTEELLGCSVEDIKLYIKSLFEKEMTWKRFLNSEIEIHHLQPCYTFDLRDPEQQKECFHFSNLYPVWKVDHRYYYKELHNV